MTHFVIELNTIDGDIREVEAHDYESLAEWVDFRDVNGLTLLRISKESVLTIRRVNTQA